jgi:hypothetical protein
VLRARGDAKIIIKKEKGKSKNSEATIQKRLKP